MGGGWPAELYLRAPASRVRGGTVPGTASIGKAGRGSTEGEGRARSGAVVVRRAHPAGRAGPGPGWERGHRDEHGAQPPPRRADPEASPGAPPASPAQWKGERDRSEAGEGGGVGGCMNREVLPRRSAAGGRQAAGKRRAEVWRGPAGGRQLLGSAVPLRSFKPAAES